ncbi:MAG: hypothetical protein GX328_05575 [Clostridiaceae bacterium]|nr:hypothetical protein [Clostridiaceae bacterium]
MLAGRTKAVDIPPLPKERIAMKDYEQQAGAEQQTGTEQDVKSVNEEQDEIKPDRTELKYSDEDLDGILAGKIARERERYKKLLHESNLDEDLKKREIEVSRREREFDCKLKLEEMGLPLKLAEFVDYSSTEKTKQSFDSLTEFFSKTFNETVDERVNTVLKAGQKTPPASSSYISQNPVDAELDKIFKST